VPLSPNPTRPWRTIPAGFITFVGFIFSSTGPPGSAYPWGQMTGVILVFFLGPVALGALMGRLAGRWIARLHRDY